MTAAVRLSVPVRKTVLLLHILSGVGWMGLDIGLFSMVVTALTTSDGRLAASCFVAIGVVVPVGVGLLSLLMVGSGVALGLGTHWRLLKHWWVLTKLVIGLAMTVLVFVALIPGVAQASQLATFGATGDVVRASLGQVGTSLLFPPVVSFSLLAFSAVLSVFKPWGRIVRLAPRRRP
ncbi:hypothetical protein [Fodinicola feengrottensis]|uniref:DUF2269 domain-containing protein n=1 Tax=Fodinicola feengrottensis TaxID=435914 RepID=A0ABN2GH92_9ACTN|nr:hypothetical protein [Fodinicola feengrottensis]